LKGSRWEVLFKKAGVLDKPMYLYYPTEAAAIEGSKRVGRYWIKASSRLSGTMPVP
jgi:hypothetical protein